MLKYLKLENIGPADQMELELGSRLNILTGDNGLGKSFLLDVAWFVYTQTWPAGVNQQLMTGLKLFAQAENPRIHAHHLHGDELDELVFDFAQRGSFYQTLDNPAQLAVYLMADGSCCVFDPYRNIPLSEEEAGELPEGFVFTPRQIFYGLANPSNEKDSLCEGLIRDWSSWQKENKEPFLMLSKVLEKLSEDPAEPIKPGKLTRISILDSRDMPTINIGSQENVAIVHASSSMKRIVSLAYLLVWAWEEHLKAAKLRRRQPLSDILFLIDEMESHLHPRWQRTIVAALLQVTEPLLHGLAEFGVRDSGAISDSAREIGSKLNVQLITTTHSPLVMASLEPLFDPKRDSWFDLDMVGENGHRAVQLRKREFFKLGGADEWLTSEAFDLESTRSVEAERVLHEVEKAMNSEGFDNEQAKVWSKRLAEVLPEDDEFFTRWRYVGQKQGWLK